MGRERRRVNGESRRQTRARLLQTTRDGVVASGAGTGGHAVRAFCARSDAVHRIQIFNSTSNIPLRLILRASITPKSRRVSKNSINKSCRSTYHLQLLLKLQSLIRPGLGDTRFQSGVHENWNHAFSHPWLSQISSAENSCWFKVWASVWLAYKLI